MNITAMVLLWGFGCIVSYLLMRMIYGEEANSFIPMLMFFLAIYTLVCCAAGAGMRNQKLYPELGISTVKYHTLKLDENVVSNWVEIVWLDGKVETRVTK